MFTCNCRDNWQGQKREREMAEIHGGGVILDDVSD
jgi:hypothetical protein